LQGTDLRLTEAQDWRRPALASAFLFGRIIFRKIHGIFPILLTK
jgi:hypothetical protein